MSVSTENLLKAAKLIHRALEDKKLTHSFSGGLEMVLLGSTRPTVNVDVEVKKQIFSLDSIRTIKSAFIDKSLFRVVDGTSGDGFRVLCNVNDDLAGDAEWIDVDFLSRGSDHLPKHRMILDGLPFLPITDLIVEKIKSCAQHKEGSDAEDVNWLVKNLQANITYPDILSRIRPAVASSALYNHSSLAFPFSELGLIDLLD